MSDDRIALLDERARALRRHILSVSTAQYAHLGGSMSCADIMAALFFDFLRLPWESESTVDHFLLSKGHSVHAYHACLAELGQIAPEEIPMTGQPGSRLGGHPTLRAPGVEIATGSLGHALSVGIGIALGEAHDGSDSRTVVLLGDGELQEGSVWEAALTAPHFGLDRLVAIIDANGFQSSGETEAVMPLEPLAEKWRAFGWNTTEIDGHDMSAIVGALDAVAASTAPVAIIARTVKGKGVPGIEGTQRAHYIRLTADEEKAALAALEAGK
jgi:transketolase